MSLVYEKLVAEKMIRLYCSRGEDHDNCEGNDDLCPQCRELVEYACLRLDNCRYGDTKPSCRKCPVHCYNKAMRQKMRQVMRFSGPRMFLCHPLDALKHMSR